MKIILGLGNPGKKYENTRHNLGFMVIDELARKWTKGEVNWQKDKKSSSMILKFPNNNTPAHKIGNVKEEVMLVKPQTFMNGSGYTVGEILKYFRAKIEDLWVVHDDIDLPLGKIKIRLGGAAAGHHGVESIIELLKTDKFLRFRIGVSHPRNEDRKESRVPVDTYVLQPFANKEKGEVRHVLKRAVEALEVGLKDGPSKAMNEFNQ